MHPLILIEFSIIIAYGVVAPVSSAGSITLSCTLSLHNCLLVPTLSSHLLYVGQVTKQLNCALLMFLSFCLLQDIRTKMIIGHGTKRRGLYYVDDVAQGFARQVQGCDNSKLKTV